jgi:hypothetical protein
METVASNRTLVTTAVAALAVLQGVFGVLRALHWFDVGSDLMGQGLLLLPLIGVVAFLRGVLVGAIALLYVIFACGALLQKAWAWWHGLVAAVVNLLLVLSVVAQGEPIARNLLWAVIPLVILGYLFTAGVAQRANGTTGKARGRSDEEEWKLASVRHREKGRQQ